MFSLYFFRFSQYLEQCEFFKGFSQYLERFLFFLCLFEFSQYLDHKVVFCTELFWGFFSYFRTFHYFYLIFFIFVWEGVNILVRRRRVLPNKSDS